MEEHGISVSPGLIIALHPPPHPREPRKLVGWVPGAANRTLLTRVNALVLAELAVGRVAGSRVPAVHDPATWGAAVKSLVKSGLCLRSGEGRGRPPPFESELEHRGGDAASSPRPLPSHLQLVWNFAMRPGSGGLTAFSVPARRYLVLPPEAVDVLLSFVNAAEVEALLAETPAARAWVEWFVEHGLLVAGQVELGARVVASRFADLRASLAREQAQLAEDVQRLATAMAADPASRLDERTPLYFVCVAPDAETRGQLPLAQGMLMAQARNYEGGALLASYRIIPELLFTPSAVREAVERHGPGVVFFSNYVWTHNAHLRISKTLKEASREFVTVHGGPSVPSREAEAATFLAEHGHVDVAVRGEGEMTAAELLKALAPFRGRPSAGLHRLREVAGLTFRDPSSETGVTRTADRARATDVNVFPSAFLSGSFDACQMDEFFAAIIETNRGCPYGCTFCDWGQATLQKIRSFDLERVRAEIEWIATHRIPIIICADANFGIFDRDLEIARMVTHARQRHGFPRQFLVNYAKNATKRVAEIVRIFRDGDVSAEWRLGLQTTDEATLDITRRSNIKPKKFDELLHAFRELKLPVEVDLMMGLPGATIDSFASDLQHCIDRAVSAKAYPTRVLVNSPMGDPAYREKYRIETDESGEILSTFSFTRDDLQVMKRLYGAYLSYEVSGALFYVLRYLQWDHGIQATDFMRRLIEVLAADPSAYPALVWVDRYSPWNLNVGGWRPVHEDLARYICEQHGISESPALATVLRVQEAVTREPGRRLPEHVSLPHDFAAWWRDHGAGTARQPPEAPPLHAYPPGELVVEDPEDLCQLDLTRQRQYGTYFIRWELRSALRAAAPAALFLNTG